MVGHFQNIRELQDWEFSEEPLQQHDKERKTHSGFNKIQGSNRRGTVGPARGLDLLWGADHKIHPVQIGAEDPERVCNHEKKRERAGPINLGRLLQYWYSNKKHRPISLIRSRSCTTSRKCLIRSLLREWPCE